MLYVHLNRVIKRDDLDMIYIIGPGHGGPSLVAHAYLEGTYSEVYPNISQDAEGMKRLFKQFSFPGGIPSHVAPETPGSIHEGGELGYALSHAYGAAFDNPDLIVACVVGDGEAETGPAGHRLARQQVPQPGPRRRVLPILHLNGYKIANPASSPASRRTSCESSSRAWATSRTSSRATTRRRSTSSWPTMLDAVVAEIKQIQRRARAGRGVKRPAWPMIVFRTPKGWTCPPEIDGKKCEDYWRATRCRWATWTSPSTSASSSSG